ncbi:MAG: hypothetical protein K9H48_05230, partial [Melioribacteraceae bacterium]|nr:hypothetical protein [Melioribacteraceae bacterium]
MNRKYITLSNPRFALTLIISFALLARVIALRDPSHQFFGWLNHVYYYFVQVRELMDSGNLAFNDLPLLFYIYSALAYFLELFGFARETSIIYSTRIYMTVIPVLIPILVYLIVVRLNDREIPSRNQLLLIFCSGFLPLSLLHMPEYLQKNMFGILLLIGFIYYSYKFLSVKTKKDGLILIIFILFITLSHFGTLAALLMLITSMIIASAAIERKLSGLFKVGGGLI